MECVSFSLPSFLLFSAPYTQMSEQLPVQAKHKTQFKAKISERFKVQTDTSECPVPQVFDSPNPQANWHFFFPQHDLTISSEAAPKLCGANTNCCLLQCPSSYCNTPSIFNLKAPPLSSTSFCWFFLIVQICWNFTKMGRVSFWGYRALWPGRGRGPGRWAACPSAPAGCTWWSASSPAGWSQTWTWIPHLLPGWFEKNWLKLKNFKKLNQQLMFQK